MAVHVGHREASRSDQGQPAELPCGHVDDVAGIALPASDLVATAAAGLVSSKKLADNRRWAVTIIVVVAAVVTPTGDPYTLLLLSGPLYLLYEITIWLIRWTLRK